MDAAAAEELEQDHRRRQFERRCVAMVSCADMVPPEYYSTSWDGDVCNVTQRPVAEWPAIAGRKRNP